MKKQLITLFLFSIGFTFGQDYFVFEKNKKNRSLFDYDNPNSLVSILVQNQDIITDKLRESDPYIDLLGCNNFLSGNLDFVYPREQFVIPSDGGELILDKSNVTFKKWLDSLLDQNNPEVLSSIEDGAGGYLSKYDMLNHYKQNPKDLRILEASWNEANDGNILKRPKMYGHYDVYNISLIVTDSINIHFFQMSQFENKYTLCLTLPISFLNELHKINFIDEQLSKKIYDKLRDFQIKARDIDQKENQDEFSNRSIYPYITSGQSDLFKELDEFEYGKLLEMSSIKMTYKRSPWFVNSPDGYEIPLIKGDRNTFQDWLSSLLIAPEEMSSVEDGAGGFLSRFDDLNSIMSDAKRAKELEISWNEQKESGDVLLTPQRYGVYWIDNPNAKLYVKTRFNRANGLPKDSVGSLKNTVDQKSIGAFKTEFVDILFTNSLNEENVESVKQLKPSVIMSFGAKTGSLSEDILKLLEEELTPLNLTKEFDWFMTLNNQKNKVKSSSSLKLLIHCSE
jgi:hypothetical protein